STASLTPAARKRTKAIHMYCWPEAIAQTTIGTSNMRPRVMRFGILKAIPASGSPRHPTAGNAPIPSIEYDERRYCIQCHGVSLGPYLHALFVSLVAFNTGLYRGVFLSLGPKLGPRFRPHPFPSVK